MFLIVIGAVIGALIKGIPGLLIGGLIGYGAGQVLQRSVFGGLRVVQTQLIDSVFAVMGAVCKADNVVTRNEINTVERMFDMLRLSSEQRDAAKAAFNRGKQPDFDLDTEVDRFSRISRRQGPIVQLFLQLQVMAVAADGTIHPAEHDMLVRIARRLGLHESDVSRLEALLRAAAAGPSTGSGTPPRDRLNDAYAALGVTPETNPADIKRAYRKLISENHPDKLASRGIPESMRPVAEERSREINSAYDLIKAARDDL